MRLLHNMYDVIPHPLSAARLGKEMRLLHNMYDVISHPLSAARQGDEAIAQYV